MVINTRPAAELWQYLVNGGEDAAHVLRLTRQAFGLQVFTGPNDLPPDGLRGYSAAGEREGQQAPEDIPAASFVTGPAGAVARAREAAANLPGDLMVGLAKSSSPVLTGVGSDGRSIGEWVPKADYDRVQELRTREAREAAAKLGSSISMGDKRFKELRELRDHVRRLRAERDRWRREAGGEFMPGPDLCEGFSPAEAGRIGQAAIVAARDILAERGR